jgi:hypothetical protein
MSWISLFKSAAVATSQALESSRGHLDLYPLAHLWVPTVFRYTTGNDVRDTGFLQWVYLVPMLLKKMGNQGFCTIFIPNSVRECVPLRDRNGFESCLKTRNCPSNPPQLLQPFSHARVPCGFKLFL